MIIERAHENGVVEIALNDAAKRNALSMAMFDAVDKSLQRIGRDDSLRVVILRGEGPAFCAGFDLATAVDQPAILKEFIARLSTLIRSIRQLPMPVIAAVHGAAIAGGCALLSACDFVFVTREAKVGYPVHRIGISPAVTLPILMKTLPAGVARALVLSGELIDGMEAKRIGLASHLVENDESIATEALVFAGRLASFPTFAMRVTKAWLNELDGSINDAPFDATVKGSAFLAETCEAQALLRQWKR